MFPGVVIKNLPAYSGCSAGEALCFGKTEWSDFPLYPAVTFATNIELSLPYFIHTVQSYGSGGLVCIHSEAITHASVSEMLTHPKFPSLAPRSGTTILSVERIKHIFSVSKRAMKSGARWRNTWSLPAFFRVYTRYN